MHMLHMNSRFKRKDQFALQATSDGRLCIEEIYRTSNFLWRELKMLVDRKILPSTKVGEKTFIYLHDYARFMKLNNKKRPKGRHGN